MNRALSLTIVATLLTFGCNLSDPVEDTPEDGGGGEDTTTPTDTADMGPGDDEDGGGMDTGTDGGDDDGGADMEVDMGPPPLEFEEYCNQMATAYVGWLRDCYNNDYYDPQDPEIVENFAQGCLYGAPAIDAGTLMYDPAQARTCLAALEDETCDHRIFFRDVPECEDVTTGQQQLGDDCHFSVGNHFAVAKECAEGYCFNDACPGTCQEFAAETEECGGYPAISCDSSADLWCNYQTDTCEPRAGVDEDCSQTPCADGLICHSDEGTLTCIEGLELGDTCDASDDRCTNSTFCSDGTCVSQADTGQSCRFDHHCPYGDSCLDQDGTGSNAPGICRARGDDGSVCYKDFDCQSELRCVDNACTALPVEGEPCDEGFCAPGLWCRHEAMGDTGECRALGEEGDDCSHGDGSSSPSEGCVGNELVCIDGSCRGAGQEGDPCLPNRNDTCADGLFCRRDDNTCAPLGAEGEPCNPWWWPTSCQDGLGCGCTDQNQACGVYDVESNPGDVCEPALALGEPCDMRSECESNSCWDPENTGTDTCQPSSCFVEE
jgi:hypothetical protein